MRAKAGTREFEADRTRGKSRRLKVFYGERKLFGMSDVGACAGCPRGEHAQREERLAHARLRPGKRPWKDSGRRGRRR